MDKRNGTETNGFKFEINIDKTEMKILHAFPRIPLLERGNVGLL